MIVRTSAKSRLIRPGIVMMSLMPWTPWRSTSSTTLNASSTVVFFWTTSRRRSLGIVMRVSTLPLSSSAASAPADVGRSRMAMLAPRACSAVAAARAMPDAPPTMTAPLSAIST